jgi:gas vesicle protein
MNNGTKNALIGFLIGAAAGAVAGILVAPQKGSMTRKQIQKKVMDASREMTDVIVEKVDGLKDQVTEMMGKSQSKVDEQGEKFKKDIKSAANATNI